MLGSFRWHSRYSHRDSTQSSCKVEPGALSALRAYPQRSQERQARPAPRFQVRTFSFEPPVQELSGPFLTGCNGFGCDICATLDSISRFTTNISEPVQPSNTQLEVGGNTGF